MSKDLVVEFPIRTSERIKNRRGKNSTGCMVTERWLRFEGKPTHVHDTVAIFGNVMTDASGDTSRKICEFCFDLKELKAIVDRLIEEADE